MKYSLACASFDLEDERLAARQLIALYGAADEVEFVLGEAFFDKLLVRSQRGQIYFPLITPPNVVVRVMGSQRGQIYFPLMGIPKGTDLFSVDHRPERGRPRDR